MIVSNRVRGLRLFFTLSGSIVPQIWRELALGHTDLPPPLPPHDGQLD